MTTLHITQSKSQSSDKDIQDLTWSAPSQPYPFCDSASYGSSSTLLQLNAALASPQICQRCSPLRAFALGALSAWNTLSTWVPTRIILSSSWNLWSNIVFSVWPVLTTLFNIVTSTLLTLHPLPLSILPFSTFPLFKSFYNFLTFYLIQWLELLFTACLPPLDRELCKGGINIILMDVPWVTRPAPCHIVILNYLFFWLTGWVENKNKLNEGSEERQGKESVQRSMCMCLRKEACLT